MKIVGLTGYARSGKDSVGALLVEKGWHRIGFGDKVRELALAVNPRVDGDCGRLSQLVTRSGWDTAKRCPSVRRFLQALGTGVRDVLGNTTWIDAALAPFEPYVNAARDAAGIVVTDVRHENEAAAIRERGGLIVRVNRPGVGPANDHISETGVDRIRTDYVIDNDGDISHLVGEVGLLLEWLG